MRAQVALLCACAAVAALGRGVGVAALALAPHPPPPPSDFVACPTAEVDARFCEPSAAALGELREPWLGISEAYLRPETHTLPAAHCERAIEAVRADGGWLASQASPGARVALLFLLSAPSVHERVWATFIAAAEPGSFTIYAHLNPATCPVVREGGTVSGVGSDDGGGDGAPGAPDAGGSVCVVPSGSVLAGRLLRDGATGALVRVPHTRMSWGIIAAERALLAAALRDEANERFVFLSETSVPLWPARLTREMLLVQPAMVAAHHEPKSKSRGPTRLAYKHATRFFHEVIPRAAYGKGSQWVSLSRVEACLAAADGAVSRAFALNCAARKCNPSPGVENFTKDVLGKGARMVPDEVYFPTLMRAWGRRDHSVCHGTHFVTVAKNHGGHAHDLSGKRALTAEVIREIRQQATCGDPAGLHESAMGQTNWSAFGLGTATRFNHSRPVCFLFARKLPLSEEGAYMALEGVWNREPSGLAAPGEPCLERRRRTATLGWPEDPER